MNTTLRALQVYRTYFPDPPGGMQEAIRQIANSTSSFGIQTKIFTLSPNPVPGVISRPEGDVLRARSWAAPASCDLGGIAAFRQFAKACDESDVVHYQFPWPFEDVLHVIAQPRIPAVMTYQSDVIRQKFLGAIYAPLMWRTLKSMRVIVATSPAYARTSPVLSHPSIRDKVRVIPNGIVEESYSTEANMGIFDRIKMDHGDPYFLFIGVLRYYKGLHTLVQAARHVGAKIVIAGSGPEENKLMDLASQVGARNVVFTGQISDREKVALLQSCRALVLPSHLRSEAFGMVLVEAAMFGRPLISCEIGTGTSFVNAHEESGIVVPPERPDMLAQAICLLLNESALAEKMGLAARARYERLFSGAALGKAYADLYREVAVNL
ncbi:MAG: glycosyltransferase [Gallionella sp.]|nr:glycosyltransferase [Gallionella sp.]